MAKSRYFPTRLIRDPTVAEPQHYATWDVPQNLHGYATVDLLAGQQVTQYVWQQGDRFDKLASRFFGDDDYWWLIALVNNVQNPMSVKPGDVLRIPVSVDQVLEQLNMV